MCALTEKIVLKSFLWLIYQKMIIKSSNIWYYLPSYTHKAPRSKVLHGASWKRARCVLFWTSRARFGPRLRTNGANESGQFFFYRHDITRFLSHVWYHVRSSLTLPTIYIYLEIIVARVIKIDKSLCNWWWPSYSILCLIPSALSLALAFTTVFLSFCLRRITLSHWIPIQRLTGNIRF